ncbi:MAG: S1 RNA-binding domain-containing protein [Lachnospiraceae bacterium]
MDDYKDELETSFRKLSEGDLVKGIVISVDEDELMVDLNYFAPGIMKASEISSDPDFKIMESVHNGDEIEATVLRLDDGKGNLLLSQKQANERKAWEVLTQYMEDHTVLNVQIKGVVNKGVVAYVEGIRGFIPASLISVSFVEDCNPYLGKNIDVQVITVDQEQNRLVLSGKAAELIVRESERAHKIAMVVPGVIVEGTVESLKPYGAFVNIGDGLSGLVHISQISAKRIKAPSEVLQEGQTVKAKVLNTNDGKISLSIRALSDEMVDEKAEFAEDVAAYATTEEVSTSLGDLLSKFKLDK